MVQIFDEIPRQLEEKKNFALQRRSEQQQFFLRNSVLLMLIMRLSD